MTENRPKPAETNANMDEKDAVPRTSRSIRFSDSEWAKVEQASRERGMTAAELVRHAAMSLAEGKFIDGGTAFTPGHAALLERIFRATYILTTLKRDEMMQKGHGDEMSTLVKAARNLQASLLSRAAE